MKKPSYTTAVVGDHGVIEGILEEPKAPCCAECGGLNGVEDLLPGSAGKGASIGASVGSVIPGVGTAIGGAVGAVAGAVSDLFGGGLGKHCKQDGHDVPCPDCAITDIECFKKWALSRRPPSPAVRQAALDAVRRARIPNTPPARPKPKPVQARRVAMSTPRPIGRPARPMNVQAHVVDGAPEPSSAVPIAIGAVALLAAGGGAWWWWQRHAKEAAR
jgi:hypothetical protein